MYSPRSGARKGARGCTRQVHGEGARGPLRSSGPCTPAHGTVHRVHAHDRKRELMTTDRQPHLFTMLRNAGQAHDREQFVRAAGEFLSWLRMAAGPLSQEWDELVQLLALEQQLRADSEVPAEYAQTVAMVRSWLIDQRAVAASMN
jgi:hypothetical protein